MLLVFTVVAFGIGIYLQDKKHEESTAHAWKANRYNLERFNKVLEFSHKMNAKNWNIMRDSIDNELDTLMILRFRKEVDSLGKADLQAQDESQEIQASFVPNR